MAKTEHKRSSGVWLILLGIAAAVAIVFAIRYLTRDTLAVRVAPATVQTLSSTVPTNGQVEPVGGFQAHSPFAGVVERLFVHVGDHVVPGTPLLDMDSSDARREIAAAQAGMAGNQLALQTLERGGSTEERNRFSTDIANARIDQKQAATNVETLKALQAQGAASQSEVLTAQQRLDAATAALHTAQSHSAGRFDADDMGAARARLADSQATLAAARDTLAQIDIKSPISGTVYYIKPNQYSEVPAGDDLIDIADLNRVQVRAYFDEPEIGSLAVGQPVKIVWAAKPNSTWHGRIVTAPSTVIAYGGTRNVGEAVISVDNARGDLLPNTNVTVTVTTSQRVNVLSVPREALHTEGASSFVYRIVDGRLSRTPVTTGLVNLISAEIKSGLKSGDQVVLGPVESGRDLEDGVQVKVVQ
jgi:HlyD family secretion protein